MSSAASSTPAAAASGKPNLCDMGNTTPYTLPGARPRTHDASGQPLNVMGGCGVMAEYATLHENNVVKVTADVPLDRCALVGCGVMTGWGALQGCQIERP